MYSLDISSQINCNRFGRMRQSRGWENKNKRTISFNLLVVMISGEAVFNLESESITLSRGEILVIPANTLYTAITDSECEYYFFHFDGAISKEDKDFYYVKKKYYPSFTLPNYENSKLYFDLKTTDTDVYQKIFTSVLTCVKYQNQMSYTNKILFNAELLKILVFLGTTLERSEKQLPPALEKMMIYITSHITSPISVTELSNVASISVSYAGRLFTKYLNMTMKEYINHQKLLYSVELFENSSMNVSQIADYLGYNDIFYFSRIFKKKFGKSPTKY